MFTCAPWRGFISWQIQLMWIFLPDFLRIPSSFIRLERSSDLMVSFGLCWYLYPSLWVRWFCVCHIYSRSLSIKVWYRKCIFKKHLNVSLFCHMRLIESNYFSSKKMRWINCKDKCKEIKNISSDLIDYYDSSYKPLLWNETFKSWLIYGWSVWLCCEKYEGFNALYCSESGQFV